MTGSQSSAGAIAVRVIGIVLSAIFGIPFLMFVWLVLSSRFGLGGDPHGYGLIFGTLFALFAGLLTAVVVPMIFRPGLRANAYGWSMLGYVIVAAGLITALMTA